MADDASEDTSAVEANTFEKDAGLCSCEGGVDCSVSYALTLPILVGLQELRLGLSVALQFAHVVPSTPTP